METFRVLHVVPLIESSTARFSFSTTVGGHDNDPNTTPATSRGGTIVSGQAGQGGGRAVFHPTPGSLGEGLPAFRHHLSCLSLRLPEAFGWDKPDARWLNLHNSESGIQRNINHAILCAVSFAELA